jgi:hypothetical protein
MLLAMPLPCKHFRPASITAELAAESTITGTRAISGSAAMRLRNLRHGLNTPSIKPSSMFTSMICAPFSTCWRATLTASS